MNGLEKKNKFEYLIYKYFFVNLERLINDHYIGKMHRWLKKSQLYAPF